MMFLEITLSKVQLSKKKYKFSIDAGKQKIGTALVIKSEKLMITELFVIKTPGVSWIIDSIEIKEGFRGNGNGTKLLQYIIEKIQKIEKLPIILVPPLSEYTPRLEAWYKRHGFNQTPKGYWVK